MTVQTQQLMSKPKSRMGRIQRWIGDQRRKVFTRDKFKRNHLDRHPSATTSNCNIDTSEKSHRHGMHFGKENDRTLFDEDNKVSSTPVIPPTTRRTIIRRFTNCFKLFMKRKSKETSSPCEIPRRDQIVELSESESIRSLGQRRDFEDAVLDLLRHTDLEVRARMQAIQMMGVAHPDILLPLKYLGRCLCKLGDYESALAVKNQMIALQRLDRGIDWNM